jgi:hypothetical protein
LVIIFMPLSLRMTAISMFLLLGSTSSSSAAHQDHMSTASCVLPAVIIARIYHPDART